MEKQISIADNVQEHIDENLFCEFMKNVTVWEYASISGENYLALAQDEKENFIRRYYSDMKSRSSRKIFYFVC